MALSSAQQSAVFKLAVGLFNAAPGGFFNEVAGIVVSNKTPADAADALMATPAYQAIIPSALLTNEQFAARFIDALVGTAAVSAADKAWAAGQIVGQLNSGSTQGAAAYWAIDSLSKVPTNDAHWGAAAATLNNKVAVAQYFTVDAPNGSHDLAALQGLLIDVTSDAASVTVAKANASATSISLSTSVETTLGTNGNDLFKAFLANSANTLQSGDTIRGGAGVDTLMADINDAGGENAIAFSSQSVEKVTLRAQHAGTANNAGDNNLGAAKVAIDAERAAGVNTWEDNNSRADLIIEDVRIQPNQITKDITIVMRETDPGHVDYGVYFDQNSLRNVSSATSQINLQVMDTRAVATGDTAHPLLNSPYGGFRFTSTNTATGVATVITLQSQAIDDAQNYADLRTAFQAAADAQFGAGVVNVSIGSSFTVTDTTSGNPVSGQEVVLSTSGSFTFTTPSGSGWIANGVVPANSGLHTNFSTGGSTSTALVTSTIVLDDVGRGSTGGDLVVGGLSVGDTSGSQGVQRFEITVEDNSKLEHISSTNNTLREVTIVNGQTTRLPDAYTVTTQNAGNLTVNGASGVNGVTHVNDTALPGTVSAQTGNQHSDNYGFSDVRLIDGSAMAGKLAFTAEVTSVSIAKYLNLTDPANNPAADNVAFVYSGGSNNDTMNVVLDSSVVGSTSTLSGREDFSFTFNGNDGNDNIKLDIGGNESAAWVADQKILRNIIVDGGNGNDTITTTGGGAVIINAGAGDDTVYADNSGTVGAKWAVNDAAPAILTDLFTNGSTTGFMYNGKLTVSFSGAGSTGLGGGVTQGAADSAPANFTNGFEVVVSIPTGDNYTVTQYHLNQAIKAAINSDPVLSKLLVAKDGPANTLEVDSLIDGMFNANDLKMTVTSADVTTLSTTDQTTVLNAYKTFAHNSLATIANAQTANAASVVAFNGVSGMDVNEVLGSTGANSGVNVAIAVTTQGVTAVKEVFTATFGATVDADTVTFDGVGAIALVAANTAIQNAATYTAAYNAIGAATWTAVDNLNGTVTFTNKTAAAVADVTTANFVIASGGAGADTTVTAAAPTTQGVTGVKEIFTATVTGTATAGETFTFDGETGAALAVTDTTTTLIAAKMLGAAGNTWGLGVAAANVITFTASAAGALTDVVSADFASSLVTGAANGTISTAESDNTINMGAGNDVLVLGTGANSNDTLVFTGYDQGKTTVVNFEDTVAANRDLVDFRAYMTGKASVSGSVDSQTPIQITLNGNAGTEANSVTVVNGTFNTTTETFAGLTAAKLLAAVNSTNTGSANYAGISAGTLDAVTGYVASGAGTTLVGGIGHAVVLVQNQLNEGEYAVFDLTFNGVTASNATADFSAAQLIGVVDFGNTVDFNATAGTNNLVLFG